MRAILRNPVKSLHNQRGMSLVELIVAAGIFAGMSVVVATVGSSIFRPMNNLNQNVYGSIDTDLSVRSLYYQFANSEVMHGGFDGNPWVTCSGHTALEGANLTQSTVMKNKGDTFTFSYVQRRTLGATDLAKPNSIAVADTSIFMPGMNILVNSLDGLKSQGLFAVTAVDPVKNTITVQDSPAQAPPIFNCRFFGRSNASVLFNPLMQRKFAIQTLGLVRYEVMAAAENSPTTKLVAHEWPFGTNIASHYTSNIVNPLVSLTINEKFAPSTTTSMLKGVYTANLSLDYYSVKVTGTGKPQVTNIRASTGYTLSGVEIANQGAVPAPPAVDNLFVTCMLTASPMMNDFVNPATGKVVSVYRVEAYYSESETVDKSSPQIVTGFTTAGAPVQCWNADQIDCTNQDEPMKLTGTPTTGISFKLLTGPPACNRISVANSLVMPVFCSVELDAQTTTSLTYLSQTTGFATNVNCSNMDLDGLKVIFSYANQPSACADDGSIFLGRLINKKVSPPATGPVLGIKTDGCTWSGSSSKSCNAYKVLKADPNAKLSRVQLTPEDVSIENGSTTLTCP